MKKLLLSALAFTAVATLNTSKAQLADGSIAPNFTVTDYASGTTHTLYDYLDNGYTVVLDMFATWCGPCWSYHQGGILETVYSTHGPTGAPNVSGSTTNDMMVIALDVDAATTDANLTGAPNSQGNWVTGTLYPMCNPPSTVANQINNAYNIAYFPTIYMVCPNRTIREVGQLSSAAAFYTKAQQCPAPASAPADVAALSYNSVTEICPGDYTPKVTIQNNGTSPLTNATITIQVGGSTVSTGTYTGNLATYGTAQVTCSTISGFAGGTMNITVTTAGDANASNGTLTKVITVNNSPAQAATNTIKIDITTDRYASETTWELTSSAGAVIASGGPWSNLTATGQTVRPTVTVPGLNPNECYRFTLYDSYGDGICCTYGNGAYSVKDVNNTVLLSGGTFTFETGGLIKTGVLGINELDVKNFNLFPNPATDVLNISFEADNADYMIAIVDLQGRTVATQNHIGLTGSQAIAFPVNDLAKGSYIVTISSNGTSKSQNVVIK